MIELSIHLEAQEAAVFVCPNCKDADTTYNGMPQFCWSCNYRHAVNIEALRVNREERIYYHRFGRTTMTTKWGTKL